VTANNAAWDARCSRFGAMTLRADADACELPNDKLTQQMLYRAADMLEQYSLSMQALRMIDEMSFKALEHAHPQNSASISAIASIAHSTVVRAGNVRK
jgi:hypothetical protein